MTRVVAIILAAGGGQRMGGDLPKQFLPLAGRPLLDRSLSAFTGSPRIDGVVLALPPSLSNEVKESYQRVAKVIAVVDGGAERQDSVRNALAAVPEETEIILVHDAVRPFVSRDLLDRCAELAREHGAVVPVVPVRDTVKQWDREEKTLCTRDRSELM
ncbi:MAG: 2-C-methyl-D-erythritol 4-phosphate cytidylyltransferase, partial [Candidatus Deferrimicrobiaceae bacterium]